MTYRSYVVCKMLLAVLLATWLCYPSNSIASTPRSTSDMNQVIRTNVNRDSIVDYNLRRPLMVAGELPDSPAARVDPNLTTSPFAGVGSIFSDTTPVDNFGLASSAVAIHGFSPGKTGVRDYIITAAHVVDDQGGITPMGTVTGDGIVDVAPQDMFFVLNFGGDTTHVIAAKSITVHPDWHGFLNTGAPEGPVTNDDIAIIQLASPLPAGVPIYNLLTTDSGLVEVITGVGYGESGSPSGLTEPFSFTVKRVGLNQADAVAFDDEGGLLAEEWLADFDGPDGSTNVFDLGPAGFDPILEGTLGNALETISAPGDSGGPEFSQRFSKFQSNHGAGRKPDLVRFDHLFYRRFTCFRVHLGRAIHPRLCPVDR